MAENAEANKNETGGADAAVNEETKNELAVLTRSERAAVILLLLGEEQAADIISYMSPREVQSLGANMVSVADLSQEAVNVVLDDFISTIKQQTNLGLGTADYVQAVFTKALGEDKAATVLGRIMPGSSSKGLDILRWMDAGLSERWSWTSILRLSRSFSRFWNTTLQPTCLISFPSR